MVQWPGRKRHNTPSKIAQHVIDLSADGLDSPDFLFAIEEYATKYPRAFIVNSKVMELVVAMIPRSASRDPRVPNARNMAEHILMMLAEKTSGQHPHSYQVAKAVVSFAMDNDVAATKIIAKFADHSAPGKFVTSPLAVAAVHLLPIAGHDPAATLPVAMIGFRARNPHLAEDPLLRAFFDAAHQTGRYLLPDDIEISAPDAPRPNIYDAHTVANETYSRAWTDVASPPPTSRPTPFR